MKTRALLLALPLVALGLGGCRDNRASISIHGICSVPDTCTFTGKCDTFFIGAPAVDAVTSTDGLFTVYVEVENQAQDNTNQQTFHTNTNDAHVDEVIVEYQGINLPRTVLGAQQRIPAAGTAVVGATILPSGSGAALATFNPSATPTAMTAVLKLGGYWDDGSRWETGEFPITVQVCSNCIPLCTLSCGDQGTHPQACQ